MNTRDKRMPEHSPLDAADLTNKGSGGREAWREGTSRGEPLGVSSLQRPRKPGKPLRTARAWLTLAWRMHEMVMEALWAYKLRSVFVVLAVALGIASLTIIIGAVEGANRKAEELIEGFGPDALMLIGGDIFNRPVGQRFLTLTWDDAQAIMDSVPGVYMAQPVGQRRDITIKYGNNNYEVPVVSGTMENYAEAWNWPLAEGRDLSKEDVTRKSRVCLIGDIPSRELFGDESPVGRSIFINNAMFTVIGKLSFRGVSGGGASVDDRIVLPMTTLIQRFNMNRTHFFAMRIKVEDLNTLDEAVKNITGLMRHQHRLKDDAANDFSLISSKDIMAFLTVFKGGLVLFLGLTAMIAMVIGGFVLANLFYLSVSERRTEIGLKKALGAKNAAILLQFLLEALALTLSGGILGLLLGLAAGYVLGGFGLLEVRMSWGVFSGAFAASLTLGIVFGIRPALAAARQDPIAALKGG